VPKDSQTPKDTTHEQQALAKKMFEGMPVEREFCNTQTICNTKQISDTILILDREHIPLTEEDTITLMPSTPDSQDNARRFIQRMERTVTMSILIPKELLQ